MSSEKKPKPLCKPRKSNRQCIYVIDGVKRCKKKATGYFFCREHFERVTRMESCAYDITMVGITTR